MQYVTLIAYFLVLLGIGFVASRRVHSLSDFYVGGKKLGYWVVAFSARASGESAWLYLGLTGMGAFVGLQAMWIVVGEMLGVGLAWFFMAKPFKRQSDAYDSITVPDYLVSRLGGTERTSLVLRLVAAFSLIVFVTIYVSAQIDATGQAFEEFLDWNYHAGAIFGFVIVAIYILSGGFVAVAWSDLFQGLIMLAGLVVLPIVAYLSLPEGTNVIEAMKSSGDGFASLWGPEYSLDDPEHKITTMERLFLMISFLAIGMGFLGSPQVFVRFMSIRDESEINSGRWVAIVFTLLTDAGAVLAGMMGRLMFIQPGDDPSALFGDGALLGKSGQAVLPVMVEELMPAILVGLFIAAVLAATMSTIDSLLVVASSAVTRDVYQQTLHPEVPQEKLAGISRSVTLALALIALAIAEAVALSVEGRSIFWFVIFGWSGIAATFCPVMVLAIFWKRFNAVGAIAAMITGFCCVPVFKFVVPNLGEVGRIVGKAEELLPSFLLAMIVGTLVCLATTSGASEADDENRIENER